MTTAVIMTILLPILGVALLIGGGIAFYIFRYRYKTASSNEALVITGPNLGDSKKDPTIFTDGEGRSMKIVRGGGVRLKMHQTSKPVPLNSFQIQLETPPTYSNGGIQIIATAIASVKVADTLKGIATYSEQFLGKNAKDIHKEISNVLGTNLRAIISKLSVEEINGDFENFNIQVQKIAQKELNNMGFTLTSFGLERIRDAVEDENGGYLENLGRARTAEVRREAAIAESNADKETRIRKSKNDQEAQKAENLSQIDIAESIKERDLKESAIKEETERARAKAEQSYLIEKARLSQQVKEEEMKVIQIEKQRAAEFEIQEQKRRQTIADTEAYEELKKATTLAEKDRIIGETEAEIILKRGKAEAEAKELMAEALNKYGEAAILEMMIKVLPDFAREVAAPLANIKEMKIIDMGGEGGGATNVTKNVTNTMVALQESLKETTGLDIVQLMENFSTRGNKTTVVEKLIPLQPTEVSTETDK